MDRYESILETIKSSKKEIKIFSVNIEVLNCIKKRYEINEESLLGTILFKTGGIIVEGWLRIYGYGTFPFTVERWNATFEMQEYFEQQMNCSIYDILPKVKETTFIDVPLWKPPVK